MTAEGSLEDVDPKEGPPCLPLRASGLEDLGRSSVRTNRASWTLLSGGDNASCLQNCNQLVQCRTRLGRYRYMVIISMTIICRGHMAQAWDGKIRRPRKYLQQCPHYKKGRYHSFPFSSLPHSAYATSHHGSSYHRMGWQERSGPAFIDRSHSLTSCTSIW